MALEALGLVEMLMLEAAMAARLVFITKLLKCLVDMAVTQFLAEVVVAVLG